MDILKVLGQKWSNSAVPNNVSQSVANIKSYVTAAALKKMRTTGEEALKKSLKLLDAVWFTSGIVGIPLALLAMSGGAVIGAIVGLGMGITIKIRNRSIEEGQATEGGETWMGGNSPNSEDPIISHNLKKGAYLGAFGFYLLASSAFGIAGDAFEKTKKAFNEAYD
jgi:hypothetical protein